MRRSVRWLAGGLVGFGAIYTGCWFYAAHRVGDEIGPWADAQRQQGLDLRWQTVAVEGYPLAFRVRLGGVRVDAAAPEPIAAAADTLVAETTPWAFRHWRFAAPNGASIRAPLTETGADAARIDGTLTLVADNKAVIAIEASGVSGWGAASGLGARQAMVTLDLAQVPPDGPADPPLQAKADLVDLTLPPGVRRYGERVDELSLSATLKGRIVPGPLKQMLALWRDDGGTLELEHGHLRWGETTLEGSATVRLDQDLQPAAAITAYVSGQNSALDRWVATGAIKSGDAETAKWLLRFMVRPGPDGTPRVAATITIADGTLFLGKRPLFKLPRVVWR